MGISERLPGWQKIAPVYAVIVLIVYGWSLLWYLWTFPSWLKFLTVSEILLTFSFVLATNLLESLLVLAPIVAISLLMPKRWFRDVFVARGAALAIAGLGSMMLLALQFRDIDDYPADLSTWLPAAVAVMLIVAVVAGRLPFLRKGLEAFAERATVLLLISIPLSVLALITSAVQVFL